jgi:hypothetical protein
MEGLLQASKTLRVKKKRAMGFTAHGPLSLPWAAPFGSAHVLFSFSLSVLKKEGRPVPKAKKTEMAESNLLPCVHRD